MDADELPDEPTGMQLLAALLVIPAACAATWMLSALFLAGLASYAGLIGKVPLHGLNWMAWMLGTLGASSPPVMMLKGCLTRTMLLD